MSEQPKGKPADAPKDKSAPVAPAAAGPSSPTPSASTPPASTPAASTPPAASSKMAEPLPDADELREMVRDGRAAVRAKAVPGLAAMVPPALELALLLRDTDAGVAGAAAEAIARLGVGARSIVPQIATALASTQPQVTEIIIAAFADIVGKANDDLILALDVPGDLAMRTLVQAASRSERRGVALLIEATRHESSRIRSNAVAGLAAIGKADTDVSVARLTEIEATDPVPDIRATAKQGIILLLAKPPAAVIDPLPKDIPDFEERKLALSELTEYAGTINIDAMALVLSDGRNHVKINAARALAVKGGEAARAAKELGMLLRDGAAQVRREGAKALGKIGKGAVAAVADLVAALGDAEAEVVESAAETLVELGEAAVDALLRGLDTASETHGREVRALLVRSPRAPALLVEAFKSPAVNVQVNAALAMGELGKDRVGPGLPFLLGARTGGDGRLREAVRIALAAIDGPGDTGPRAITVDGFDDRCLPYAELEKHKAELSKFAESDLPAYLRDGRDVLRANAATALAVVGNASVVRSIGVLLRDASARVRLAAAIAVDKLGDDAVVEAAGDLVGVLGDGDAGIAETTAGVLRARKGRVLGALLRGLETDNPLHAQRILALILPMPDATECLCDAFANPAVNVQVNAAIGLGMLGPERVGKGRKLLEGSRTRGWERTREAVFKALELLDGPPKGGPSPVEVDGFESRFLGAEAFTDKTKLRLDDLVAHLQDGRPIVRGNSATALGVLGAEAASATRPIGVLLRDDDLRVRMAAVAAIDKLGDDAVKSVGPSLVGAMRGDAEVAAAAARVLGARKSRVLGALVTGLETDDPVHARRILELVNVLPDACEILCDAFESPAENVQVNAAVGIGMLGAKRAGAAGKKKLEGARTRGFARTRETVFKALAMLEANP